MATTSGTAMTGIAKYEQFVGSNTIAHYTGVTDAPLVIGKQRLSYVEVATRTGLPAARAARNISEISVAHEATSIKDLYKKSSPSSVAVHGFGTSSLLMLFRLFESEGLDHLSWAMRGKSWIDDAGEAKFSTFITYKKREAKADAETHQGSRRRKDAMAEERKEARRAAREKNNRKLKIPSPGNGSRS